MYLSMLNDKEKKLFLDFAFYLASADDDYSDAEKSMMQMYCSEMQCDFEDKKPDRPVESVIEDMKACVSEHNKRIIVFEAIGLCMVDNNYDQHEREMILSLVQGFGLSGDFADRCEKILLDYLVFQNSINALILG